MAKMNGMIGDDDLEKLESMIYEGGRVVDYFYLMGGLVERGNIDQATAHAKKLLALGNPEAQAALALYAYKYMDCPALVKDMSKNDRICKYIELATPYAMSDRAGNGIEL